MDYWIAIDKQKIGPLSLEEVRRRRLNPNTLVWHRELPTWRPAGSLPELADALAHSPQPNEQPLSDNNDTTAAPQPAAPPVQRPVYTQYPPYQQFRQQNNFAPGQQPQQTPPEKPTTYLGWNIAAIVLCCFIPAVIGLIYSLKVNSRYNIGDYAGAERASNTAEMCLIISIVAGLVMLPFQVLINLASI